LSYLAKVKKCIFLNKLLLVLKLGESRPTAEVEGQTLMDIPSSAPSNLEVVPKTATALHISWRSADRPDWNSGTIYNRIWYAGSCLSIKC